MTHKLKAFLLFSVLLGMVACTETPVEAPAPFGALPTERQLAWQEMEFYAFVHFTTTTFRDVEWGYGDADPDEFQPSRYDPAQWVEVMKAAGMKGVILTAKHHDGFCLWPTKETDYCISNSSWRDGKGDVVGDLSREAEKAGLKFGVYLSPWDRHDLRYSTPAYIDYYRAQLRELLTQYGPIFEVWEDGANGGDGYYGGRCEQRHISGNYYDWENTTALIHELQPNTIVWGGGLDARWCGNESGWMPEPNWAVHDVEAQDYWNPAEVDVSIRPGWFYHEKEDGDVKSLEHLMKIYYESIGRGANLILNIPPNKEGRIHPTDSTRLVEFGQALKREFSRPMPAKDVKSFSATNVRGDSKAYAARLVMDGQRDTYWATDDSISQASVTLTFRKPHKLQTLRLREPIQLGQRIEAYSIEIQTPDGQWEKKVEGTTIGPQHLSRLDGVEAQALRVNIEGSKACPLLSEIQPFLVPEE